MGSMISGVICWTGLKPKRHLRLDSTEPSYIGMGALQWSRLQGPSNR